jgi:Acyl-CoA dehydrogenase, N-terminal domain
MASHGEAGVPGGQSGPEVRIACKRTRSSAAPLPARGPGWAHRGARLRSSAMSLDYPAFELTEEHQELRAVVRALADDKIAPRAAEVDETGEFPWDVHDALARAELTAVHRTTRLSG